MERWSDLVSGPTGLLEPPAGAPEEVPAAGDAAVVPGVAFDRTGARLGRGGGFYDRAFPPGAADAPLLVGFAHSFQVVERVPCESHDRRMDAIVTENGMVWVEASA